VWWWTRFTLHTRPYTALCPSLALSSSSSSFLSLSLSVSLSVSLSLSLCVFLFGFWIKGLVLARQVLYCLSQVPQPFLLSVMF
jgi:hypothetical protein